MVGRSPKKGERTLQSTWSYKEMGISTTSFKDIMILHSYSRKHDENLTISVERGHRTTKIDGERLDYCSLIPDG